MLYVLPINELKIDDRNIGRSARTSSPAVAVLARVVTTEKINQNSIKVRPPFPATLLV